jgi:hypothetical protein
MSTSFGPSFGLGVVPPRSFNREWTPFSLGSKLLYWLDAEAAGTLTLSGSLVNEWRDRKGANVPLTQGTSGFKPSYSATALQGRPAVIFDGADDYLQSGSVASFIPSGTSPIEMWSLAEDTGLAVNTTKCIAALSSASATRRAIIRRNTAPHTAGLIVGNGTGAAQAYSASAVSDGIKAYRAIFANNDQKLFVNDLTTPALTLTGVMQASSNRLVVGAQSSAASFWQGPINTILFTAPLSNEEAAHLMNYIKTRGGIA